MAEPDRFEQEVAGWIQQERRHGEIDLERIEFNVVNAYRRLVRFPERCKGCGRNGSDHDMECPTQDWIGPDHGVVDG